MKMRLVFALTVISILFITGFASATSETLLRWVAPSNYDGGNVHVTSYTDQIYIDKQLYVNFDFVAHAGYAYWTYFTNNNVDGYYTTAVLYEKSPTGPITIIDGPDGVSQQFGTVAPQIKTATNATSSTWTYTTTSPPPAESPTIPIQTILKLSSTTNAHGEIYSGTNYNTLINYNNIFGKDYTKTSPNACNATNVVLKLSVVTNAHAQTTTQTGYTTNVCYGDLVCTAATGGASCPAGKLAVVKLSGVTNAHLATRTASSTDYPVTICCDSPFASGTTPPTPPTDSDNDGLPDTWETNNGLNPNDNDSDDDGILDGAEDSDNDGLTNIEEQQNGTNPNDADSDNDGYNDGVEVNAGTNPNDPTSHPEGQITRVYWADNAGNELPSIDNLRYEGQTVKLVAETTSTSGEVIFNILEDDGLLGTDEIRTGLTATIGVDGNAVYSWTITSADLTAGGIGGLLEGDELEFIFSANGILSGTLNVVDEPWENIAPTAVVDLPEEGNYLSGQMITFTSGSYDSESNVTVEWDILNIGGAIDSTQKTFNQAITLNAGEASREVTIKLTAKDAQGAIDSTTRIITIDNLNIVHISPKAIITAPTEKEVLISKSVSFDGTESYTLEFKAGPIINCLGGACPSQVSGVNVAPNGKVGVYSDMMFRWTFGSDNTDYQEGLGRKTGNKVYSKVGRNKEIKLTLSISGKTSIDINLFDITQTNGCSADGSYYIDTSGLKFFTSWPTVCSLTTPGCCPSGSLCVPQSGGSVCSGQDCAQRYEDSDGGLASVKMCSDYNNVADSYDREEQCTSDCNYVGVCELNEDGEYDNPECQAAADWAESDSFSSECVWDGGECALDAGILGDDGETVIEMLTLGIQSDSGCVDGERTITFTDGNTQTFDCSSNVIQLPFFSVINALMVLVILGAVYWIVSKKG